MNLNKIYFTVNEIFDSYVAEGVKPDHLLTYLNNDSENLNFIYNRAYRKLTLENTMFESDVLKNVLKDVVRDRVAFYNDTKSVRVQ
jgi:hypothetical protein